MIYAESSPGVSDWSAVAILGSVAITLVGLAVWLIKQTITKTIPDMQTAFTAALKAKDDAEAVRRREDREDWKATLKTIADHCEREGERSRASLLSFGERLLNFLVERFSKGDRPEGSRDDTNHPDRGRRSDPA